MDLCACRELVKTADLTKPHLWYPMARAMRRRIVYHAGPTNSGKTYQALQASLTSRLSHLDVDTADFAALTPPQNLRFAVLRSLKFHC